jgi:uncharacterized lipoprotein YmbA
MAQWTGARSIAEGAKVRRSKMRRRHTRILLPWVLAAGVLLTGCLSLRGSDAASFYLLSSMTQQRKAAGEEKIVVGVGPIDVPEYLNRPQIVTRRGPNELRLAEFHKWAEPLMDGIARVLAANLAATLPVEVVFFPWRRAAAIDYQIIVQVHRFDTDPEGNATLQARWALFGRGGSRELIASSDLHTANSVAESYADRVGVMSLVLADLSESIVRAVNVYEAEGGG